MADPAFQLTADGNNGLRAIGQITFANATQALAAMPAVRGRLSVDLATLEEADSAALAVIVGWSARAQAQGADLSYVNAPARLCDLAHVSDLDGLFAHPATPGT